MDLLFPDVRTQKLAPRLIDNTARFSSPFTQATRSIARGGDRWGFGVTLNDLAGPDRARVESFIAKMGGAANRVIFTPTDYVQRGSFPGGELFTNYNFANGTSGWAGDTNVAISAIDRGIRVTNTVFDAVTLFEVAPSQSVTLAQYVPYLIRFFTLQGRGIPSGSIIYNNVAADGITGYVAVFTGSAQALGFGPMAAVRVPLTAGAYTFGTFSGAVTGLAGDYYDVLQASCSRCALVDNGPNLMLNSDDFGTTWAPVSCTVTTNTLVDPQGLSTADVLVESGASAEHVITQTATVPAATIEYCAAIAFKANGRNFAGLGIYESTGSSVARGDFNVSTGALLGTASGGGNWANVRQYSAPLGNGWYYCAVIARKVSAATTVGLRIYAESAAGTVNYTGSGAAAIGMFRGTLAQGSFPTRLAPTAGSAFPSGILQTGTSIYIRGLPASTNGLLLPGDWFELNKEMKKATNSLNSDAAGLGYLQFSPSIRTSPADTDPVVINSPAGRFILATSENGWEASPGGLIGPRATYTLDLVEAA